jgi:hypothetical protein
MPPPPPCCAAQTLLRPRLLPGSGPPSHNFFPHSPHTPPPLTLLTTDSRSWPSWLGSRRAKGAAKSDTVVRADVSRPSASSTLRGAVVSGLCMSAAERWPCELRGRLDPPQQVRARAHAPGEGGTVVFGGQRPHARARTGQRLASTPRAGVEMSQACPPLQAVGVSRPRPAAHQKRCAASSIEMPRVFCMPDAHAHAHAHPQHRRITPAVAQTPRRPTRARTCTCSPTTAHGRPAAFPYSFPRNRASAAQPRRGRHPTRTCQTRIPTRASPGSHPRRSCAPRPCPRSPRPRTRCAAAPALYGSGPARAARLRGDGQHG